MEKATPRRSQRKIVKPDRLGENEEKYTSMKKTVRKSPQTYLDFESSPGCGSTNRIIITPRRSTRKSARILWDYEDITEPKGLQLIVPKALTPPRWTPAKVARYSKRSGRKNKNLNTTSKKDLENPVISTFDLITPIKSNIQEEPDLEIEESTSNGTPTKRFPSPDHNRDKPQKTSDDLIETTLNTTFDASSPSPLQNKTEQESKNTEEESVLKNKKVVFEDTQTEQITSVDQNIEVDVLIEIHEATLNTTFDDTSPIKANIEQEPQLADEAMSAEPERNILEVTSTELTESFSFVDKPNLNPVIVAAEVNDSKPKPYCFPTPHKIKLKEFNFNTKNGSDEEIGDALKSIEMINLTVSKPTDIVHRTIQKLSHGNKKRRNNRIAFGEVLKTIEENDTVSKIPKSIIRADTNVTKRRKIENTVPKQDPKIKTAVPPVRKPQANTPVRTKLPNFSAVHNKIFNNMENIVDYTKRKEDRAKQLLNSNSKGNKDGMAKKVAERVILREKKIETNKNMPNSRMLARKSLWSTNPPMKDQDRKDKVAERRERNMNLFKKQNAKQTDYKMKNSDIIQGVRSNRRFMLQMAHRNSSQTN